MRRKLLLLLLVLPLLLVAASFLYLRYSSFSWLRGPVERRVTRALGRELAIEGGFDIDVGRDTRVVAEKLVLANATWAHEPAMVEVERLELVFRLASLRSGPLHIRSLDLEGVRVRLQRDANGRANWGLGRGELVPERARGEPLVLLDTAHVRRLALTSEDARSGNAPLEVEIAHLDVSTDDRGSTTTLAGTLGDLPVELTASSTKAERLLEGDPLVFEAEGRVGNARLHATGRVDELATLAGTRLGARIAGPDVALVTDLLDLPSLGHGPFRIEAALAPSAKGSDFTLDADLVEARARAAGSIDSLLEPADIRMTWGVSAVDLNAAGALVGIKDLPHGPYEASGEMRYDGNVVFREIQARLGENVARIEGTLRAAADIVESKLRFEVSGPDLSIYSRTAGIDLPPAIYRLEGWLTREGDRISIDKIVGRVGRIDLELRGTIDERLRLDGATLQVRISGPDLDMLRPFAEAALPEGVFDLEGRVTFAGKTLVLTGFTGRAGETRLELSGTLCFAEGLEGTELDARVWGPDPGWLSPWTGLDELVARDFELNGAIRFERGGRRLSGVSGRYGDATFRLDGFVGLPPRFAGTDLTIGVRGEDLSWLAAALELADGAPSTSFDVDGRVHKLENGLALDPLRVTVGDAQGVLRGRIGSVPDGTVADLQLEVHAEDLSTLGTWPWISELPAEKLDVRGRVVVEPAVYVLHDLTGTLGAERFTVDGRLTGSTGLAGSEVRFELAGPDLGHAARVARAAGILDTPEIPLGEYSLSGRIAIDETGFDLQAIDAQVDHASARLSGRLGRPPAWHDTRLAFDVSGPDASFLSALCDLPFPGVPFVLRGRVQRERAGVEIRELVAGLGDYRLRADGALGEPPRLVGTDLDLHFTGPGPELLVEWIDLPLPPGPVEMQVHLQGEPEEFSIERLRARLGHSDLDGSIAVDLRGSRPRVEGHLFSRLLELTELTGGLEEAGALTSEVIVEKKKKKAAKRERRRERGRLIPDVPLDLSSLQRLDADLSWTIDRLQAHRVLLDEAEVALHVADGRLRLGPVTGRSSGGNLELTLVAEPLDDGRNRFAVGGRGERLLLSPFPFRGDPGELPPLDFDVDLVSRGATLREAVGSTTGRVQITQAAGKVDRSVLMRLSDGALSKIGLRGGRSEVTDLECGVFAASFDDGLVRLDPLALRTDVMVAVGSGQIDLRTEKLGLSWATKPRKGVGLSTSAITNSYIKLAGTLSEPQITISPLRATGTTGAAIMTGGLSLLGKALYDRATSGRDVCERAKKKIRKRSPEPEP